MRGVWIAGLAAALFLGGCGDNAEPEANSNSEGSGVDTSAPAPTSSPGPVLFQQPVADAPRPEVRGGAAPNFLDCAAGIANAGWAPDFGGPSAGTDSPDTALDAFLADAPFHLPVTGYVQRASTRHRALFTHEVQGEVKAAVIVAHADSGAELTAPSGWVVETFATCDPAEFDPAQDDRLDTQVWSDQQGRRVPTSKVTSFTGPSHCEWTTVTFLVLNDRQYVRDPEGVLEPELVRPYDPDTDLPDDATDTGYRRIDQQLWLSATESVAYMVGPDHIEAWPSTVTETWCA